ncbi:MAG: peptidylprolyl isomerase, partial [Muribaculaceae bacterium]|nr:peptidylprolyl isomerase [Muribaculaceae bacterium]
MKVKQLLTAGIFASALLMTAQNNIIEEVAWIIGDEPIYKSEIEQAYQEALQDRTTIQGDPYCVIPENIAIERLFLHQADLDTVEVQENMVQQSADGQMNFLVANLGSRE